MIRHPAQFCETVTSQDIDTILDTALKVLENNGLIIQSERACQALATAGASIDFNEQRVYFTQDLVLQALSKIPSRWTLHARNPDKNIEMGNSNLAVVPGYGSAFIADPQGTRRKSSMIDFQRFAQMANSSDVIDITGGLLVEPNDIETPFRPLEITNALIRYSDKPFMGSVANTEGATDSIEMSKIVFGDISQKACVIGLININSPMRLDTCMANALVVYVQAGQPVLLTPGIMMGISAPVTFAGALVQAFAELIGCCTLVQVLNPAAPVIIGLGGFGSDLRNGTTGFGRPENALAIQIGAQIARRLKIPFRCSAAVTSARQPDCQSGYERMMTAMAAYQCGAHFCLQAVGILDSINMMSYEQFVIDLEIWSYIKQLSREIVVNPQTLAQDIINSNTENYLSNEHTVLHMREELLIPSLITPETYEQWWNLGHKDIIDKAGKILDETLKNTQKPPLEEDIDKELKKYIELRKKIITRN